MMRDIANMRSQLDTKEKSIGVTKEFLSIKAEVKHIAKLYLFGSHEKYYMLLE